MNEVAEWRAKLSSAQAAAIDALRSLAVGVHPGLAETIKWNAPSFALDGEDRITFGLNPRGGYRVVLHRGAKNKPAAGFHFDDPDRLADWPSPDRGVIHLADVQEIEAKAGSLEAIFRRWLAV